MAQIVITMGSMRIQAESVEHPLKKNRAAYIAYKVAFKESKLDEAYALSERAYRLLSPGKPTHAFVAATRYQQGCIRLSQARYDDALVHLKDALAICQSNELSNGAQAYTGNTARYQWRISQVLEHQGLASDARVLRDQADFTRKELYNTGLFVLRESEEESFDTLVALLFR